MINNNLLFSIIIPTFNRADALARCLQSLVDQEFTNFEVLVCDDGSTDQTKDIIAKFSDKLELHYFYFQNTGGPAHPRNVGIQNAKGKWICFLDSDDWFTSNKLLFISNINLNNYDFIYHNLNVVVDGIIIKKIRTRNLNRNDAYHDLLFNLNAIPTSSVCVRRSVLERTNGFKETKELIGLEDYHLWLNIAKLKARFTFINKSLGNYALGADNLTVTDQRQINRYYSLFNEFIAIENNKKHKNKIIGALNYHLGYVYYKNSQFKTSLAFFKKALFFGSATIKLRSTTYYLISIYRYIKN